MLGPQQWGLFFYRGVFSRLRGAWWRRFLSLCSQPYEERLDHDAPVSACVHAKVPALAKKVNICAIQLSRLRMYNCPNGL